jgi:TonB family protein
MKSISFHTALLLLLALLNIAGNVHAAPRLNGMALHVQLSEEQFIAALYTDTLSSDPRDLMLKEEDKAMELRILADNLFARRFQRMWIEGIAINAGTSEMEKNAEHLASFSNSLKIRMIRGDILRIERLNAGNATKVYLNGQIIDTIPNARFFDLLLRTWLGPVPLSSNFKDALLAAGNVNEELADRFNRTAPSAARIAEINAALQSKPATEESPARPNSTTPSAVTSISPTTPGDAPATADIEGNAPAEPGEALADNTPPPKEPTPEPEQLVTEANLFQDDAIFEDGEDSEAYSFTAENLLSEQIYIAKLTKWTGNFVSYPRGALRNQQQGTVRLTVTLARDGRVKDVQILEKSEYDTLNKAATRAVKSASPYPAVPDAINGEQFLFTVPVVFRLN